jgi:hypothetical protein
MMVFLRLLSNAETWSSSISKGPVVAYVHCSSEMLCCFCFPVYISGLVRCWTASSVSKDAKVGQILHLWTCDCSLQMCSTACAFFFVLMTGNTVYDFILDGVATAVCIFDRHLPPVEVSFFSSFRSLCLYSACPGVPSFAGSFQKKIYDFISFVWQVEIKTC